MNIEQQNKTNESISAHALIILPINLGNTMPKTFD